METNRVILANEPRLLRAMLQRVIARIPGLEVVGEATDSEKLLALVNQTEAEWVITSLWPAGVLPSVVKSLLVEHSSLCILGMAANGSQAKIVCAGATVETRKGLSLDELIAILKRRG